jgi:3-hydroxyisobutyrate dehydrogenase-like beta-hydroxyacid dehydrogenase
VNQDGEISSAALIGYGEVGKILTRALRERGVANVAAYDTLLDDPKRCGEMKKTAERDSVTLADSPRALLADAQLVISAVTPSETLAAAREAAPFIRRGTFYLDLNSASPKTKTACGACIDAAGGRYVEAGVMTSVSPHGIRVPMLIGGASASALQPLLAALGFQARAVSDRLGVASAIKMCRSIVIKGLEAIMIESLVCARRHGVEIDVLESLIETFPGLEWEKHATYFWSRVVQHGQRRAEEMREAAATVAEAGFDPFMAAAIADRQQWVADFARRGMFDSVARPPASWREFADRILERETPHAA